MGVHLTIDLLRAIHRGEREASDLAATALGHLLDLCPECRHAIEEWKGRDAGEGRETSPPEHDPSAEDHPPGQTERILGAAHQLIDEARQYLPEHLDRSLASASLARSLLQHLSPAPEVASAYAQAIAYVGNALGAFGNLREAEDLISAARYIARTSPRCTPSRDAWPT